MKSQILVPSRQIIRPPAGIIVPRFRDDAYERFRVKDPRLPAAIRQAITALQVTGNFANNTTSVSKAFASNVASGSLIVCVGLKYSPSSDTFVAGDFTKSAGTATIGTFTLDAVNSFDIGPATLDFQVVGIASAIVTGAGSLTIQVGGGVAGSYFVMGIGEFSGSWDSTRVENTNTNQTSTDSTTTANSNTAASAAGGLFVAGASIYGNGTTTISPNNSFTNMYKDENGNTDGVGTGDYRIAASALTTEGNWTISSNNSGWSSAVVAYKEVSAAPSNKVICPLM